MELRLLRYFVGIADAGSISGAARQMFVAQPALTTALRHLERELGGELVTRTAHGVILTPLGRELLPRARAILLDTDLIARCAREHTSGPLPSELRIGCTALGPPHLLGPAVDALRQAGVRTRVVHCEPWNTTGLRDGRYDVAILGAPVDETGLEVTPILCDRRGLLLGPKSPLFDALPGELSLEDIVLSPILTLDAVPRDWVFWWTFGPELNGAFGPPVGPPVSSLEETFVGVLTSGGCAVIPESLEGHARPWGLRFFAFDTAPSHQVLCRPRGDRNPATALFVAALALALAQNPGPGCEASAPARAPLDPVSLT